MDGFPQSIPYCRYATFTIAMVTATFTIPMITATIILVATLLLPSVQIYNYVEPSLLLAYLYWRDIWRER